MRIDKDVYVAMRDGVCLAVDLFSPEPLEPHPAVLLITPYEKDAKFTGSLGADGRPLALTVPNLPEGLHPLLAEVGPLVEAGYVVAVADARGTGYSEGVYDYYNLVAGRFDGYDLVEWLAEQSWCSGAVAMMGRSAAAIYCYITAFTAPPHLRAMAPNMYPADFYSDQWYVGGVFRWENRMMWGLGMYPHCAPIDPGDPHSPNYEQKRAVYEARVREVGRRVGAGLNPANLDWVTAMYAHKQYDDFWKSISFLEHIPEIDIPTLHGGVWFDHFIRGTLNSHGALKAPKKLMVMPGSLMTRAELGDGGFSELTIEWFDHFCRGRDNDVEERPDARLYLMGLEDYVEVDDWPIASSEMPLYLHAGKDLVVGSLNDGALVVELPGTAQSPDVIEHDPLEPHASPGDVFDLHAFERGCLTYTSDALDRSLDVIGTPHLRLFASSSATDVDWCVRLCDVDESGRSKLLNTGALKGSHRVSHESPSSLQPGEWYCFEIEIWPIANRFQPGHRIRLDISNSDFPFFEINPLASHNVVAHDVDHPSTLSLPIVELD